MTQVKSIYSFGAGAAEGSSEMAPLLGGKGAGLAEMSLLGVPVPPGFTITTEACCYFHEHERALPPGLKGELADHLRRLEELRDQRFGDPERPLLVSVRSGAAISMPGMMDTVLNLGLNARIVENASASVGSRRFLYDCYRRLLAMFGDVVFGVPSSGFHDAMVRARQRAGVAHDHDLPVEELETVIEESRVWIAESGSLFPEDPHEQLNAAIEAVFASWNNRRAREYRRIHEIDDNIGTGVTVQAMVFGNRGQNCATGVAFSRDPSTGGRRLFGEYLVNAQGEDVVAGTHTPEPIQSSTASGASQSMATRFPVAAGQLEEVCETLERHFRNMQDIEFTIENDELFLLQTRAGKRSGPAAVRMAVDMVRERLIDRREALRRVEPQHLIQMMAPVFDHEERQLAVEKGRLVATGLGAGPGAASGQVALTAERAAEMAMSGPVLLVRDETSPEDIVGMHASSGILTTRGGMTSHAAVVARGLGKPCIVGAGLVIVDDGRAEIRIGEHVVREGDLLSIDGGRGEVILGALEAQPSEVLDTLLNLEGGSGEATPPAQREQSPAVEAFLTLLDWADRERRLGVRANADTPEDARVAATLGAAGIGLCRTEHMFFDEQRIPWVRRMILAQDDATRAEALAQLLPMQQADFEAIFEALPGLPVTIRLLDPPLHEFLPHDERAISQLAEQMGVSVTTVADQVESLRETNPMLGHRGCRLGITFPAIYEMQAEAIARAACRVAGAGIAVHPEIMVPLVGTERELEDLRQRIERVALAIVSDQGAGIEIPIGTMIEVPRAALQANRIAQHADFFSFGTNDLTQMTFGYSRDDAGRFLPAYLEDGVLPFDPFERLDADGVGQLVEIACRRGRMARPTLKLGVCGEHGGEPHSIEFFERCGLDYVSCSPYRVPVARLSAARACLAAGPGGRAEPLEGHDVP